MTQTLKVLTLYPGQVYRDTSYYEDCTGYFLFLFEHLKEFSPKHFLI